MFGMENGVRYRPIVGATVPVAVLRQNQLGRSGFWIQENGLSLALGEIGVSGFGVN